MRKKKSSWSFRRKLTYDISSPKYLILKEKKMVICTIKYQVYPPAIIGSFMKIIQEDYNHLPLEYNTPSPYYFEGKIKGIAQCVSGDEFNEEVGKKIAYKKAMLKVFQKINRVRYGITKIINHIVLSMYIDDEVLPKAIKIEEELNNYLKSLDGIKG